MRRLIFIFGFFAVLAPAMLVAQIATRAASTSSTSTATQLPLSGRSASSGSVTTTETPIPGATTSVNTINTTVVVGGPYAGSSPSTAKMPFNGKLSFNDALQRALEFNLGATDQAAAVRQAHGQATVSRSQLLPNVSGTFSGNHLTTDLNTLGIKTAIGGHIPFLPNVVGPISYLDLRASVTQTLVNMTLLNNYRSAKDVMRANQASMEDARDTVVLAVGASYLQVIAAKARLASERAQLETAEAIYKQTEQRHGAGLAAQLDLNQDLVRAQTERQRLATMENDLARQKINLARITGLPPNDKYDITDDFDYSAPPALSVDEAVKQALEGRADLKAAEAQVTAAERTRAAARAEYLPSLSASADFGGIGTSFSQVDHTYTVSGTVNIPIWLGGRTKGDTEQSEASLTQRRAELADTRGQIESQVRNAFLDMQAAGSQVELSKKNQQVAHENLKLTQEKFQAGVSDSVEVSQALQAVASAELDYITALFAHNLAKLNLARSLGGAEGRLQAYLQTKPVAN